MNISEGRLIHLEDRSKALTKLTEACKTWLDSPNNRQARATVRELCKINHDGTEKSIEDWDCGCSDAATDVCVSITCPRR